MRRKTLLGIVAVALIYAGCSSPAHRTPLISTIAGSPIRPAELTGEHQQVWEAVANHWQKWARRDSAGWLDSIHPEYHAWRSFAPGLGSFATMPTDLSAVDEYERLLSYEIEPEAIAVIGDIAIVHYISREQVLPKKQWLMGDHPIWTVGDAVTFPIRWTMVLVRDKGHWLVLNFSRDSSCSIYDNWPVTCPR